MSIEALEHYLDAKEALAEGDPDRAAEQLEKALGSAPDNSTLRANLGRILDRKTLAGRLTLEVLRVEIQRRN